MGSQTLKNRLSRLFQPAPEYIQVYLLRRNDICLTPN